MLVYNKTTLTNVAIQEQTAKAGALNLLTSQQVKNIHAFYKTDLYNPSIFVRIGLGFLTVFIVLAFLGLFGLMTNFRSPGFGLLFCGGVCYGMLEYMTGTKKHYSSGVDHVLMIATLILFVSSIMSFASNAFNEDILGSFTALIASRYLFGRFADTIMSIVAAVALFVLVFNVCIPLGATVRLVLPFIFMGVAIALFLFLRFLTAKPSNIFFRKGVVSMQTVALVTLYLAGNYFVVSETQKEVFHPVDGATKGLYMGWFFWAYTMIVPIGYLAIGILRKNLLFVRLGLLFTGVAILTFRHYHSILAPETAMIIAGSLMVVAACLLIKYLRKSSYGFTFENIRKKDSTLRNNVEGLVIGEAFGNREAHVQPDTTFGGGSFGGAGAEGRY